MQSSSSFCVPLQLYDLSKSRFYFSKRKELASKQSVLKSPNICDILTSGSSLVVWDVRLQQPVKIVRLGSCERVSIIRQSGDTVQY